MKVWLSDFKENFGLAVPIGSVTLIIAGSRIMTNLNDGVGEACAGQSRDIGSLRTSENR